MNIILELWLLFGPLILFMIALKRSASNLKRSVELLSKENSNAWNLLKTEMMSLNKNILNQVSQLKMDNQVLVEQNNRLNHSLYEHEDDIRDLLQSIEKLEEPIANLEERMFQIEEKQTNRGAVSATSYSQALSSQESDYLLDLPIAKILDIYAESSQILDPICKRVALISNENKDNYTLERNNQGNYWVLQLADQGFFLLPRSDAFVRISALDSIQKLFETEGENQGAENYQFVVKKAARLNLLKRNLRWQLAEKGLIKLGESPLEYLWQKEIRQMRLDYENFHSLLEKLEQDRLIPQAQQQQEELNEIKEKITTLSRHLNKTVELVSQIANNNSKS